VTYHFDLPYLSKNPKLVFLLGKSFNNFNWRLLKNQICKIDYDFLRERLQNTFFQQLMMNRFDPNNFEKLNDWESTSRLNVYNYL